LPARAILCHEAGMPTADVAPASTPKKAGKTVTPKTTPGLAPSEVFAELRAYCLAKAGAVEEYPWGDTVWKVKGKLFAGGHKDTAHFTVKATPADQTLLIQHPAISVAQYVGRFGWVTIHVTDAQTRDLAKELIDDSYASIAGTAKRATKTSANEKPAAKKPAAKKPAAKKPATKKPATKKPAAKK